ncbi:DUF4153 domain-containing protein, partial [Nocardia asiatica]|uniref:DUF4153 domain-containing protein n=1 Tax=Nocardia asiatica TaxID=209252 RepID=UPI00313D914B
MAVIMRPPNWRRVACPPGVALAALVSGLAAAILIHWDRPGVGWVLTAAITASAVFLVDRNARKGTTGTTVEASAEAEPVPAHVKANYLRDSSRWWWATVALALLAVGAVRAAGWLFALCVVAACVAGSLAVVGRRSANGIVYDTLAVGLAAVAAVPWAYAGTPRMREGNASRAWRLGLSVAVTSALLAVFVPLLGSADAMFAALLETVTPELEIPSVVRWIVLFVVVALGALGAMFVLACPPPPPPRGGGGGAQGPPGKVVAGNAPAHQIAPVEPPRLLGQVGGAHPPPRRRTRAAGRLSAPARPHRPPPAAAGGHSDAGLFASGRADDRERQT